MQAELGNTPMHGATTWGADAYLQAMSHSNSAALVRRGSAPALTAPRADPADPVGQMLQPGPGTRGRSTSMQCHASAPAWPGPTAGGLHDQVPVGSLAAQPGSGLGIPAPGAVDDSPGRSQRPAWLEEAAWRMSLGMGLSGRGG